MQSVSTHLAAMTAAVKRALGATPSRCVCPWMILLAHVRLIQVCVLNLPAVEFYVALMPYVSKDLVCVIQAIKEMLVI